MYSFNQPSWHKVKAAFQKIWRYHDFRAPQGEIVQTLLAQRDTLVIMPTGGGKSICFQLPALLQTGLTLVVSPLVALMENQVQELLGRGIPAALLHSQLSISQRKQTLRQLEQQQLKLLYLSPETLLSLPVWERLCQPDLQISMLALDEAHCLAQWGETFRPAYYRLGAVRPALLKHKPPGTNITIAAFTATADPPVQKTIQRVLRLQEPAVFSLNPYRPNLHLQVQQVWTPRGRRQQLLRFIRAQQQTTGLVYMRSRRDSEDLAAWLEQQGYSTSAYHAGLSSIERRQIEQSWLQGNTEFVICTNAFGLGINKPNVRWVVHFHAPFLLSEYVQEIGRAGRDGKPAVTLTLISETTGLLEPEDKRRRQFFQEQIRRQQQSAQTLVRKLPAQGEIATVSKQFKDGEIALSLLHSTGRLEWSDPFHYQLQTGKSEPVGQSNTRAVQQMVDYLKTRKCRWQMLLHEFGFKESQELQCGHCDNCDRLKGK
ncbi:MAG: ATP-dependent DNA helicase RecQ [Chroococcidiopsidaceae cyanobacterium CP_BM_ER_R8_30]|nr:ATP-dependent DNA helicase RecQ [Chroococcidiopsidaceae cyanobacterium CP_BM_ER_R8_30]